MIHVFPEAPQLIAKLCNLKIMGLMGKIGLGHKAQELCWWHIKKRLESDKSTDLYPLNS